MVYNTTLLSYLLKSGVFAFKKGIEILAEYTYALSQEVASNSNVIFNTTIPCNRGYIYHREESGVFILRGIVNNPSSYSARYQVTYNGNVSVPTGETPGPISLAIAIDGEVLPSSTAIVTPTVVDALFNVTVTAIIDVPRGCCLNCSIENNSDIPINVANSNLVISRIA